MSISPGWKNSEFWLHILFAAVGAAYQVASQSSDPTITVVLQVAAAVYTASRTFLKSHVPAAPAPVAAPPAATPVA